jgi:uncharacterized protein YcbK (DUF882 family)
MVRLDNLRMIWGKPLTVYSAYRCTEHNRSVGGAVGSMHLEGRAFDLAIDPMERTAFVSACRHAGFTGLGIYESFVHVDDGSLRTWGIGI